MDLKRIKMRLLGFILLFAETIGCGGGKFYTGFTEMPEHVPTFVSLKERYKQTPQMVIVGVYGTLREVKEVIIKEMIKDEVNHSKTEPLYQLIPLMRQMYNRFYEENMECCLKDFAALLYFHHFPGAVQKHFNFPSLSVQLNIFHTSAA